jgi:hypothetical protein
VKHFDDLGPGAAALVQDLRAIEPPWPSDEDAPPQSNNGHKLADQPSSWQPVPLTTDIRRPEPTHLRRNDGQALLYAGRTHLAFGETEVGKTFLGDAAAAEAVNRGDRVLFVDFEDDETTTAGRLLAIGITPAQLDLVTFIRPEEPLLSRDGRTTRAQRDFHDVIHDVTFSLGLIDGTTESMAAENLNPNDGVDVAKWHWAITRPLAATGAAVLVLDHVVKDPDNRGRYATGSPHKLNILTGAAYSLDAIDPIAPGRVGRTRLTVAKDRPGSVKRHMDDMRRIAEFVVASGPEGWIGVELVPPQPRAPGGFEPTELMRKVSDHLALYPGTTARALRDLGRGSYVDQAVKALIAQGYVKVDAQGPGKPHLHHLVRPYPDPDEAAR